ncbi:MAG: hypothetical protein VKQ33_02860 [Candidatus Sericytochromatia bacterium]|nr:hypothetical protein [Candidatus Sericytochromatia bacterium]
MRTCRTLLALALVAASLAGCGKNPTASAPTEQRVRFTTAAKPRALPSPAAPTPLPYQAAPPATVVTRPGATPGAIPGGTPVASTAPGSQAGAVRLKVRTFGAAPVGSLVLNVVSHADPTLAAMVPLAMNGAEANWETEDLPPGLYDLILEVRDPGGARIGSGKAVADVRAGEIAAVSVDLTVEMTPTVPATPGPVDPPGNSGVAASTPPPSTGPVAEPTPAPGQGGTLGIRVEFI